MIGVILTSEPFVSIALVAVAWSLAYFLNFRHAERPSDNPPFISPEFRSQNDEGMTEEDRDVHSSSHG